MLGSARFKILAFLLVAAFAVTSCKRDRLTPEDSSEFEDLVEREMRKQDIPAMATLIFRGNDVLYEGYFGKADVERDVDLGPEHSFLLASISKTATAAALMQLYDQGLFSLDDPINDHLPFSVNAPDASTDITIRMLLTHSSSIADGPALDGQYYYGTDSPTPLSDFMEAYLVPGGAHYDASQNFHDFEPGTDHEYSNIGSALIGVLVEEISGMEFNAYCKQALFPVLNMTASHWRLDEMDTLDIVRPYQKQGRDLIPLAHYTFTDYPNGGLRATPRDLHQLAAMYAQGGSLNGATILQASTVADMLNPQIPDLDPTVGLHLFLMDQSNGLWGHDGGESGVSTTMAFHPSTQIGVIILTNQGDAKLDDLQSAAYHLGENL